MLSHNEERGKAHPNKKVKTICSPTNFQGKKIRLVRWATEKTVAVTSWSTKGDGFQTDCNISGNH